MEKVEDEWQRFPDSQEDLDLLFVKYNANAADVDEMLSTIKDHGFEPTIKQEPNHEQ